MDLSHPASSDILAPAGGLCANGTVARCSEQRRPLNNDAAHKASGGSGRQRSSIFGCCRQHRMNRLEFRSPACPSSCPVSGSVLAEAVVEVECNDETNERSEETADIQTENGTAHEHLSLSILN